MLNFVVHTYHNGKIWLTLWIYRYFSLQFLLILFIRIDPLVHLLLIICNVILDINNIMKFFYRLYTSDYGLQATHLSNLTNYNIVMVLFYIMSWIKIVLFSILFMLISQFSVFFSHMLYM